MNHDLQHLSRALVVRAISRAQPEDAVGAALAVLRADVMTGVHDEHPAALTASSILEGVMSLGIGDMPPPTDLVAILLETLSQRRGGISRAMAWQAIGINPNRGRDLLARNAGAVDWPIWYTLRQTALSD